MNLAKVGVDVTRRARAPHRHGTVAVRLVRGRLARLHHLVEHKLLLIAERVQRLAVQIGYLARVGHQLDVDCLEARRHRDAQLLHVDGKILQFDSLPEGAFFL